MTGTRSVDLSKIGLVAFTARTQMTADAAGTLAALASCGFQNAEFSGSAGNFYGKSAAQLAPVAAAVDIDVPSLGVSQANLENNLDAVIAEAHAIGAEYVRISGSSRWTLADYSKTAAILNEVGAKLKPEASRSRTTTTGTNSRPRRTASRATTCSSAKPIPSWSRWSSTCTGRRVSGRTQ